MGEIKEPQLALPIVGMIFVEGFDIDEAIKGVEEEAGRVLLKSDIFPFSHTTYYDKEMGKKKFRCWYAFDKTVAPDALVELKRKTNEIETNYLNPEGGRRVNMDPGVLTLHNLVLASTKDFYHRIYLGRGIFGEVTLIYTKNEFQPLEWTYPDYREESAFEFFLEAREALKERVHT